MPTATTDPEMDRYFDLVRRFPLRHLRDEASADRANEVLDELLARPDLTDGERDYLHILTDLVERYEAQTVPIASPPDADRLRFFMSARSLSQATLARDTGIAESTVSEILSGKRTLNRDQILTLADYFRVSRATFL